jgi:photosystem II stability/assembly factor-like uncharacterized protein
MKISVSPNGTNFYDAPAKPTEILVGTADGVVEFSRTGSSWEQSNHGLQGKHVGSMTVDPRSGIIFAGTHKGGLWASEDGGIHWDRRDNGIESDNIYGLNHVHDGSETRIYAGTEPAHLYVSSDFGKSWTELPTLRDVPSVNDWTFPGPPHVAHVKNIVFDPRDPNTIYAGIEVGGAFKSTDAGKTWKELNAGGFYEDVHRMFITPARPDDVYMATGRCLYHSPDAGTTWEEISLPGVTPDNAHGLNQGISYPDALVILPEQPDLMFTAGAAASPGTWRQNEGAFARVGRSRDGGKSWEYLAGGLPQETRANFEAMTMAAYPGGFALVAGSTDGEVFLSEDEGESWTALATDLAPISKSGHYRGVRDWQPATV